MRTCLIVVQNQQEADNMNKVIAFSNGVVNDSLKIRHSNGYMWDILTPVGRYFVVMESYMKSRDDRFRGVRVDELVYMGGDSKFYNEELRMLVKRK